MFKITYIFILFIFILFGAGCKPQNTGEPLPEQAREQPRVEYKEQQAGLKTSSSPAVNAVETLPPSSQEGVYERTYSANKKSQPPKTELKNIPKPIISSTEKRQIIKDEPKDIEDFKEECPLTVALVRAQCGISASAPLKFIHNVLTPCTVVVDPAIASAFIDKFWYVLSYDTRSTVQVEWPEGAQYASRIQLTNEQIQERAAEEIRGKTPEFEPELQFVRGVGDFAFYGNYPLLQGQIELGMRDAGFAFYTQKGDWEAVFSSGGAETFYQTTLDELEEYKSLGAGCSTQEVANIAKQVAMPHLERIANAERLQNTD